MNRDLLHPAGAIEFAERGVYWARYLKHGRPICYAVNSNADVIRRLLVTHDARAEAAIEHLWNLLETVDPADHRPQLRVVKPIVLLPGTGKPVHLEVPDPYLDLPLINSRHLRRV